MTTDSSDAKRSPISLDPDGRPASQQLVSLSQAVLGPLDALVKAQIHAARSFLNFVFQVGFPSDAERAEARERGEILAEHDPRTVSFDLEQTGPDNLPLKTTLKVPTLALLPITPLAIDSATFDLELSIKEVARHTQQKGEPQDDARRPWYLVPDPISIRGTLADEGPAGTPGKSATIKIHVQVQKAPLPAALTRLIGAVSQQAEHKGRPDPNSSTDSSH